GQGGQGLEVLPLLAEGLRLLEAFDGGFGVAFQRAVGAGQAGGEGQQERSGEGEAQQPAGHGAPRRAGGEKGSLPLCYAQSSRPATTENPALPAESGKLGRILRPAHRRLPARLRPAPTTP